MSDDQTLPVELALALAAEFDNRPGFDGPALTISAGVIADVTVELPGITVCVRGIEQDVTVVEFGLSQGEIAWNPPAWQPPTADVTGTVDVNLPAVTGGGGLTSGPDGSWAGALQLSLSSMSIAAFALIGGEPPLSFAIVLCARFPLPGIQIGFGFAVSGVGGVLAVNRRSDRDALTAAVLNGSIDELLFAHDPQGDAARITANLEQLFPTSRGQVVVGPMLEIAWGAGLLTADIMLIVELPNPLQISLLGRLAVDLPFDEDDDDDIAIIHLEARVAAIVTPGVPEVRIVASINGSRILFFPLTGDMFLLIRGGPEATFVFSAGGFHPSFTPPPNVPPLQRIGMTMVQPLIELRLGGYVAVTTSSVQVGAQVQLTAGVAGCGLRGSFGFDALIEWKPQFHFEVDVRIALAVEVFDQTLCGVAFSGSLTGPGPWHLHGKAEVEVLWVTIELPIDATFGAAPPTPALAPIDVNALLVAELSRAASWTVHPPAAVADGVTLTPGARSDLAAATVLHPGGGLQVAERLVPLGISIDRYAGQNVPAQQFAITSATIGEQQFNSPTPVQDTFADGMFTTLPVEQQLTVNGFTSHPAGIQLTPTGLDAGTVTPFTPKPWNDIVVPWTDGASTPQTTNQQWTLPGLASLVPTPGPATAVTIAGDPLSVLPPQPATSATAAAYRARVAP